MACTGAADAPILIAAQSVGGVEIAGEAGFRLAAPAAYVVIRGFRFTHKAGSIQLDGEVHHCRISRNEFALQVDGRSAFLGISGHDNEIDYNLFRDKDTEGQMLYIQGPGGDAMAQRNWVHHNYFLNFRRTGRNNSTALHIGSSWRSMSSAFSVVEHNLFVNNVGENEGAICNKSSDNVYRYNTIRDSTELSLRHGHRVQVYANALFDSEGIRFFGKDHRIFGNYLEGCRPAIHIGNGGATIPPGRLTSHERPDRVQVVHNTLVNNRVPVLMRGREQGLGAEDLMFANNLIVGGGRAVSIAGPLIRPVWEGNIIWGVAEGPGDIPDSGFTTADPMLTPGPHGLYRLSPESPAINSGVGHYGFVDMDVEGHPRPPARDVGADEFTAEAGPMRPLTPADVGPNAPKEPERPLISAPTLAK